MLMHLIITHLKVTTEVPATRATQAAGNTTTTSKAIINRAPTDMATNGEVTDPLIKFLSLCKIIL